METLGSLEISEGELQIRDSGYAMGILRCFMIYFFNVSSRFALNSLPGFHSGNLFAFARR